MTLWLIVKFLSKKVTQRLSAEIYCNRDEHITTVALWINESHYYILYIRAKKPHMPFALIMSGTWDFSRGTSVTGVIVGKAIPKLPKVWKVMHLKDIFSSLRSLEFEALWWHNFKQKLFQNWPKKWQTATTLNFGGFFFRP